jgi:hypothetical protein
MFLKWCSAEMWGSKKWKKGFHRKFLLQYDSENLSVIIFINFTWNHFYFCLTMILSLGCFQTDRTTTFRKRFFLLWNCALVISTTISWCSNYIQAAFLGNGNSNSTRYCSVLLSTVRSLVYHTAKPKMERKKLLMALKNPNMGYTGF